MKCILKLLRMSVGYIISLSQFPSSEYLHVAPHLSRDSLTCDSLTFVHADANSMHQLGSSPIRSHPSYLLFVHVLLDAVVQVLPPLEEQRVADEFEPGRKLERGVIEHGLQSVSSNVFGIADFVQIGLEINVGFDEENVVNCMVTRA
jgi:hypothetical protein